VDLARRPVAVDPPTSRRKQRSRDLVVFQIARDEEGRRVDLVVAPAVAVWFIRAEAQNGDEEGCRLELAARIVFSTQAKGDPAFMFFKLRLMLLCAWASTSPSILEHHPPRQHSNVIVGCSPSFNCVRPHQGALPRCQPNCCSFTWQKNLFMLHQNIPYPQLKRLQSVQRNACTVLWGQLTSCSLHMYRSTMRSVNLIGTNILHDYFCTGLI